MSSGNNQDTQTLVEGLNEDLAGEYQALIMYNTYAAGVVGVHRKELEAFFRAEIPDELRHAEFLANKITAMGGTPVVQAEHVKRPDSIHGMLKAVHEAESQTIDRYKERAAQADVIGDVGLVNDLEDIISDETGHKEECEKMLKGNWE